MNQNKYNMGEREDLIMENFTYSNPTKLIFGKGQLEQLKTEIPRYGKKVLLVYGGGSIKRMVFMTKWYNTLKEIGIRSFELSGC